MSLFTEDRLRTRVRNQLRNSNIGSIYNSPQANAKLLLKAQINEQRTFSAANKTYDIFLSHSSNDAELVEGLRLELKDMGYSVYVDWIEDPELDRSQVSKDTALMLQQRMKNCKSLIYAFSESAASSKWMPWELGYFDGIKGTVAVLPISLTGKSDFKGSEYLGIYYYIQIDQLMGATGQYLWIHETSSKYVLFNYWLSGSKPTQR